MADSSKDPRKQSEHPYQPPSPPFERNDHSSTQNTVPPEKKSIKPHPTSLWERFSSFVSSSSSKTTTTTTTTTEKPSSPPTIETDEHYVALFPTLLRENNQGVIKTAFVNSISETIVQRLQEDAADAAAYEVSSSEEKTQENGSSSQSLVKAANVALANYLLGKGGTAEEEEEHHHHHKRAEKNEVVHSLALDLIKQQRTMYLSEGYYPSPTSHPESRNPKKQQKETTTPPALPQLIQIGSWLIPSPDIVSSLRPTILWLPTENGPLQKPTAKIIGESLPLAQHLLDDCVKNNLKWVLKDEEWRSYVKEMTRGYIVESYGSKSGNNNDGGEK